MNSKSFKEKHMLWVFASLLASFAIFLSFKNYTPDTFLTGWDTLHPEFNFSIYWERILNGAWQDHQGLGTAATQAHSSEIPRVLVMQLLSLVFEVSLLRYLYSFLMLLLGPLGLYFLVLYILKDRESYQKYPAAFLGSLFYLLNLSTLQHFYVPLEMFLVHFGSLGWIFLSVLRYIDSRRNSGLQLFLLAFFFAPQAHTSTLFFSFIIVLAVFLFLYYIKDLKKNFKNGLKKSFGVLFIILAANAFWIGPNIYFILSKASDVANSKIHRLFSEEAFLQNHEYGSIENTALMKGFLFNWGEHIGNGVYGDLMDEWIVHLGLANAEFVGYGIFFFSMVGIFMSLYNKNKFAFPFLGVFLISFFFITNTNFPTGILFEFLRDSVPLFKEAFRFPFTKFSSMVSFSLAIFFAFFAFYFLEIIRSKYLLTILVVFTLSTLNVYMMLPAFKGNLISDSMRVSIPNRYFEMFEYLNSKEEYGRVANFPIHSFWGWSYYNWSPSKTGYQGAGFLWFGLKQPLLDREFDRWGSTNEDYYRQMSYAVYSRDQKLFDSLLEKYSIKWLLLDKSVFQPGANDKMLFFPEIESLFSSNSKIHLDKDFGDGLRVYSVDATYNHLEIKDDVAVVGNILNTEEIDPIYLRYKDYVNSQDIIWPFVGITQKEEMLFDDIITTTDNSLQLNLSGASTGITRYGKLYLSNQENTIDITLKEDSGVILATGSFTAEGEILLGIKDTFQYINSNSDFVDLYIGDYEISAEAPLTLNIFKEIAKSDKPFTEVSVLESCSLVGDQSAYEIETNKSGFNLSARNVRACVTTALNSIYDLGEDIESKLIVISSDIIENFAYADLCLLNSKTGVCEGTYTHGTQILRVFNEISPANKGDYFLRFFADSKGDLDTSVSYGNILVSVLEKSESLTLNLDDSVAPVTATDLLELPKSIVFGPDELKLLSNPQLCATGDRDVANQSVKYTDEYLEYASEEKFLCDSFLLPSESAENGYILEVTAQNVSGLPLRMCLTNEVSTRCDLYVSLPWGDKSTSYYLLPPVGAGRHVLNITSLNFQSQSIAVNQIYNISLTRIPYEYLKELHSNIDKPTVKVLTLSESYDPAWVAFCGIKICDLEHVLVNNWQNGWILDSDEEKEVTLVYIPQLSQYLGYGLFFVVFTGFIFTGKRPQNTSP